MRDDPCVTVDSADTAIEVGDDEFWMLMAGRQPPPVTGGADRRRQTGGRAGARQRELAEEAGRAEAIEPDELRRSLLSAVGHDLHAAGWRRRPRCPACAPMTWVLPGGHRRTAATVEGVGGPVDALVDNLLDSSRLAAARCVPS